jgi:hypothetical protein
MTVVSDVIGAYPTTDEHFFDDVACSVMPPPRNPVPEYQDPEPVTYAYTEDDTEQFDQLDEEAVSVLA